MAKHSRPTPTELIRRIEALETALDRMVLVMKEDLAVLREDLRRREEEDVQTRVTRPPPTTSASDAAPPSERSPRRTISEERAAAPRRDPRSDD